MAVILLIALAIDDLIHFLNGDASVIGEFFEKMGIVLMMHVRQSVK